LRTDEVECWVVWTQEEEAESSIKEEAAGDGRWVNHPGDGLNNIAPDERKAMAELWRGKGCLAQDFVVNQGNTQDSQISKTFNQLGQRKALHQMENVESQAASEAILIIPQEDIAWQQGTGNSAPHRGGVSMLGRGMLKKTDQSLHSGIKNSKHG
jgi:hypothetical protein